VASVLLLPKARWEYSGTVAREAHVIPAYWLSSVNICFVEMQKYKGQPTPSWTFLVTTLMDLPLRWS